ncbi:MAG: DUF1348 family protein, partial [Candidatus Thiodiazotropha sp.]
EFPVGREEVHQFLVRKWAKELDYRLIKELWSCHGHRIAVRFAYECHDDSGQWYRAYGNENLEFNHQGFMERRYASINDLPIKASERKFFWPLGRRPDDHPGLSELTIILSQACRWHVHTQGLRPGRSSDTTDWRETVEWSSSA